MLPFSEACERNKRPILARLKSHFARVHHVLEIGSGTGQHAVFFARALPHLVWQPTELAEHLAGLKARCAEEGPENLRPPIALDVASDEWPVTDVDAVFSANTLHIMSWERVGDLFAGVGRVLKDDGVLCVYGPFRYHEVHTSDSNVAFDASLRRRDPHSGIRDFHAVDELAAGSSLAFVVDHEMPANNRLVVWRRTG